MTTETGLQDMMHGSIFVLLKRFVEGTYDYSTWVRLLEKVGVEHASYQMQGMYPTDELFAIVHQASEDTGIPAYELMEQYGEFLVPDLLLVYKKYIKPEWRTYEMLLNTEKSMHGAVKKEDSRTSPPKLLVTQQGENRLVIDYYSKRRMCGVAVGIIKGIAKYYGESDMVTVTRMSDPYAERVQILVDFKK
ncbi:heme NO-binding domain-containing protein [Rufibacter roseolus]|uniref:heme NO-binding domain-containing protein n=1 Tax=Rufibacter roseolus TaxID=2817375 RepID=UPI001B30707C|nr:heme NO-binding domain-containing protein [Rufibacter roseolus]